MKAKVLTKEKILETVIYRMVNRKPNEEALKEIPHISLLDLAAVYCCISDMENGYSMELLMSNDSCKYYGIQPKELDAAARHNTEAAGFTVQECCRMLGLPEEILPWRMYVITNQQKQYGASALLYEDCFRSLADQEDRDLYILPSSIHELIAVPVATGDLTGLQDIVREINCTKDVISPDEVLSNNVYRYSRDGGLTCAASDGKRK